MQFRPGSVVVFEGLDRTVKTTHLQRHRDLKWATLAPSLVLMPSGFTKVTVIFTPERRPCRAHRRLRRQLLHLASKPRT